MSMYVLLYFHCRLTELSLANNSLQGSLVQLNWTAGSPLRFLNLSGNLLTGSLPDSWSSIRVPVTIDLSRNRLSGLLPVSWGNVGADGQTMPLRLFNASSNNITGRPA
jgi:hypothetical protein